MPDGVSSHGPSIDGGQNLVTISIKCATLKDSAPPKNSPVSRNYVSREGLYCLYSQWTMSATQK